MVTRHRNYFRSGATRSLDWRSYQLTALRAMMTDRAEDFYAAPWTDLRRNRTDADLNDVKFLAAEADHTLTRTKHTATSDDEGKTFETDEIAPGQSSKPVKFEREGEFKCRCEVHGKTMSGTVVVKGKAK